MPDLQPTDPQLDEPSTVTHADPSSTAGPVARPADPPGFALAEEVGRGGMGVVYRAHDKALRRDVAVKVLQDRYPADGPAARRFVAEARVTAQLQHPGVPAVYHVGELPGGRPFLAMKLIRGDTLADLLQRDGPGGRWLATFEGVCQAVGYAHSRGVIHRDLKPANVMVGAFGEVQVMDWGLAKELVSREAESSEPSADGFWDAIEAEPDDRTRAGSVLGTWAYMPPEQANGEVDKLDARSDVFGLGAVLCTLLTGAPPYAGADADSTRALSRAGTLRPAFDRLAGCGADPGLVALCRRCLAAQGERPADGGAVAEAVAGLRAAADERARAAEVERGRAAVREAEGRKRRRLVTLAAGVLAVAAGAAGWQWRRADRALVEKGAALDLAEDKRRAAERSRAAALDAVRGMTDAAVSERMARSPTLTPDARRHLADIRRLWERLAAEPGPALEAKAARAEGHARLANIHRRLADLPAAERSFRAALAELEELVVAQPGNPSPRVSLAEVRHHLAGVIDDQGRPAEAEPLLRAAVADRTALVAEAPADAERRRDLADSLNNLGLLLRYADRAAEAEPVLKNALAARQALADSPDPSHRARLASAHANLGDLYDQLGRRDDSLAAYRTGQELADRLAADHPDNPDIRERQASGLVKLGNRLRQAGRRAEAEERLRAGVAAFTQLAADFPLDPDHRDGLGGAHTDLGILLTSTRRKPAAEQAFRAALAVRERLTADQPGHPRYRNRLAGALTNLATVLDEQGRPAEALPLLLAAGPHHRAALAANPANPAARQFARNSRQALLTVLLKLGDHGRVPAAAAELAELGPDPRADGYNAGCFLAQCVPLARQDGTLPAAVGHLLAERYAARAVGLLRAAVAAGFADHAQMAKDTDLDPLRDRLDFRWLLARVRAAPPRPAD